jgi:hypothetical protein
MLFIYVNVYLQANLIVKTLNALSSVDYRDKLFDRKLNSTRH